MLISLVTILAVATFPDYGITWDWVGDLYVAERNLNFLTSAKPTIPHLRNFGKCLLPPTQSITPCNWIMAALIP